MDPILGQIILWPVTTFIPVDWMECNGQLLQINQYQALYSLLGNTYGGNAPTTFGLPDLRGRVPIGVNTTPFTVNGTTTISQRNFASMGGTENSPSTLLQHTHGCTVNLSGASAQINTTVPMPPIATANTTDFTPAKNPSTSTCLGVSPSDPNSGQEYDIYANIPSGKKPDVNLGNSSITINTSAPITGTVAGTAAAQGIANATVNTMQPFLALKYIIAVNGIYPQRP